MKTINAGCQGTYAALSKFVNLVDRSPRFLIIESMVAAPQQTGQTLNVTIKIDTFIKDSAGAAVRKPALRRRRRCRRRKPAPGAGYEAGGGR